MLFYFQFSATNPSAIKERNEESMVVHSLVLADNVDTAADQVISSMRSVYLKIGDIRRAFAVRSREELGHDQRLLSLSEQVERSRYAFLFEFPNGSEALYGPSLSPFIARTPFPGSSSV